MDIIETHAQWAPPRPSNEEVHNVFYKHKTCKSNTQTLKPIWNSNKKNEIRLVSPTLPHVQAVDVVSFVTVDQFDQLSEYQS